jgi:hypothetical protein
MARRRQQKPPFFLMSNVEICKNVRHSEPLRAESSDIFVQATNDWWYCTGIFTVLSRKATEREKQTEQAKHVLLPCCRVECWMVERLLHDGCELNPPPR